VIIVILDESAKTHYSTVLLSLSPPPLPLTPPHPSLIPKASDLSVYISRSAIDAMPSKTHLTIVVVGSIEISIEAEDGDLIPMSTLKANDVVQNTNTKLRFQNYASNHALYF
jgi:hypothetical protein